MSDTQLLLKVIKKFGYEVDNDGQVVIYTGLYEHDNGNLYDEPQEK
jgi:hypothetical protein